MDDNHDPIRPEELDGLFTRFAALGPCVLAVSGGSDSTALMVLFADWLRQRGRSTGACTVLTVDHGLRASSADEARAVAASAVELGYRHATLAWEGPKPRSGIQAAARTARYRLMGSYMRAHGLGLLLAAHTRDELGISDSFAARPLQAALASAGAFAVGATLPILTIALGPWNHVLVSVVLTSLVSLIGLGAAAAHAGGASARVGAMRVAFWGALAMAVTAAVGWLFGAVV